MSSGMVGVLVSFYHELTERKGHFVLCGVRPPVQKVFEITRLDQLFRLEPDVTHGVTHLNIIINCRELHSHIYYNAE